MGLNRQYTDFFPGYLCTLLAWKSGRCPNTVLTNPFLVSPGTVVFLMGDLDMAQ